MRFFVKYLSNVVNIEPTPFHPLSMKKFKKWIMEKFKKNEQNNSKLVKKNKKKIRINQQLNIRN